MAELEFTKGITGLVPSNDETQEYISKLKLNSIIKGKFTKVQNPLFHRKMMSLLRYAYDTWEPPEIDSKWGPPAKSFDQFREDLTILAGYYDVHYRVDGSLKVTAKSLSYDKLDADEREKLYSKFIDVILKHVLKGYSRKDLDDVVNHVLGYV